MRFLLLTAILLTGYTQANAEDFAAMAKEMTACKTDDECMVVQDICADWAAINKTAEKPYSEMVAKMRPISSCPVSTPTPKPAAAQCSDNICEVK